jgi:hypothetical protein
MVARQKRVSSRARARGLNAGWLDVKLEDLSSNPVHFRVFLVVIGLVVVAWVGFVATVMLLPSAPPKTAAARPPPPPILAARSMAEDDSYSPNDTNGSEPLAAPEPAPFRPEVSRPSIFHPAPLRASAPVLTATPALKYVPLPPTRDAVARYDVSPMPSLRRIEIAPVAPPAMGYDKFTAIYDISAHTVYLPDGKRLEAHSGLGDREDDARYVNERDRGPTPPHLYDLTMRESLFHGVQALRLTPVGNDIPFDRTGLLAHPYMLGPNGDSNGCVSFKDYDAFLRAFQYGEVKRLQVVARLADAPRQVGRLASLGQGLDR